MLSSLREKTFDFKFICYLDLLGIFISCLLILYLSQAFVEEFWELSNVLWFGNVRSLCGPHMNLFQMFMNLSGADN